MTVRAKVAFAAQTPLGVAYGGVVPPAGRRFVGDTVNLHAPDRGDAIAAATVPAGDSRLVELVVNGRAAAARRGAGRRRGPRAEHRGADRPE